jgi:lipoprotein-releasing system permease protein
LKSLFELFVGLRYLKSKKSQGFISFNTLLSIFIVFIGVFILIIVISVMNGFQSQIKDKILDVDSHITVMADSSEGGIVKYNRIAERIKKIPGIESAIPYFQGQALFRYGSNISPVIIRGLGSIENIPKDISNYIIKGKKNFSNYREVYIGEEMANYYQIFIGQKIELIVPKGRFGYKTGVKPGIGKFKVIGFFKTGYYEYDTKIIFMSLKGAQKLYAVGDKAWGIGIKIDDIYNMYKYKYKISRIAGFDTKTYTAEERHANLFYALKLEKLIMTIILFLVIVSAGFTIMGTLVMVVMEKRKAIGILKSMGAGPYSIMTIFILEGFFIGVIGTMLGVVLGLVTALNLEGLIKWIENSINFIMGTIFEWITTLSEIFTFISPKIWNNIKITPDQVYYIDSIPTEVKPEFVVFIAVFAVFLATVSAIFPAWYASRLKPVETIRYE